MTWSRERLKFLLDHIESFIDTEWTEIRERAKNHVPQTGLTEIQHLGEPALVLDRLAPFFESGLRLKQSPDGWKVTDVLWRGSVFALTMDEQFAADRLVNTVTPLQVQRAPARQVLRELDLDFLAPGDDFQGYLVKPEPETSFILFSNLAEPWASEHLAQAHRLINKSFVY